MSLKQKHIIASHGGCAHIKIWIIWSVLRVVSARGTLERFQANYCEESSQSAALWDLSYLDCVEECKARDDCTGANYRSILDTCLLNLGASLPAASGCNGVQYSRKADWVTKKLLPSCNCGPGKKCKINSNGDPVCVVAECSPMASVPDALIFGNRHDVSMKMTYKCDVTLTAVGQPTRTCLDSGHWSGSPVTCAAASLSSSTTTTTSTTQPPTPTSTSTTTPTTTPTSTSTTTPTSTSTTTPTTTTTTSTTTSTSTSTTTSPPTSTTTSTSTSTTTSTSTSTSTTTTPAPSVPVDGACVTSSECVSPLVCRSGTCRCPLEQIYYDAGTGTCHAGCSAYGNTMETISNRKRSNRPNSYLLYDWIYTNSNCQTKCLFVSTCTHADLDVSKNKCYVYFDAVLSANMADSSEDFVFVRDCTSVL